MLVRLCHPGAGRAELGVQPRFFAFQCLGSLKAGGTDRSNALCRSPGFSVIRRHGSVRMQSEHSTGETVQTLPRELPGEACASKEHARAKYAISTDP